MDAWKQYGKQNGYATQSESFLLVLFGFSFGCCLFQSKRLSDCMGSLISQEVKVQYGGMEKFLNSVYFNILLSSVDKQKNEEEKKLLNVLYIYFF